ncbi:MAG: hypothetical protein GEU93_14890 [Propionibacteriales bacterium]|nr:hypothetical protein [Propionibacteriales bacterium]
MATVHRRIVRALITLFSLTFLLTLSPFAHAEAPAYKFWGYYQYDGEWTASPVGPAESTPEDGGIEGWRYALNAANPERPPRTDLDFEEVCGDTEAGDGEKRLAVLIDYGTAEDAPNGEQPSQPEAACAVLPEAANGQQVLEAVADVRTGQGLVCGVNGYPASGCSETVANADVPANEAAVDFALPEDAAAAESTGSEPTDAGAEQEGDEGGFPWPLAGVAALVVVLAGGAVLVARARA